MRRFGNTLAFFVVLTIIVAASTGCAVTAGTPLISAQPEPVGAVLATAIIAPEALVPVVIEAVTASPEDAVEIATAATMAAPDQALVIRTAVVRLVSDGDLEAVVAATKPRRRPVPRLEIPRPDRIEALVERATR